MNCKKCNIETNGDIFCDNCSDEILMLYIIDEVIYFKIEQAFNLLPGTVMYWYNYCKINHKIDLEHLQRFKIEYQQQKQLEEQELQLDKNKLIKNFIENEKPKEPTKITKNNIIYCLQEYLNGDLYEFKMFVIVTYILVWGLITICQVIDFATSFLLVSIFPYVCVLAWLTLMYHLYKSRHNFIGDKNYKTLFKIVLFPPTFVLGFIFPVMIVNILLISPFNPTPVIQTIYYMFLRFMLFCIGR